MDGLIVRIIALAIACIVGGVFNYYVYTRPQFVDKPLDGWLGKIGNVADEQSEDRYQTYRRQARRNFIVLGVLFVLLIRDLVTLIQRMY